MPVEFPWRRKAHVVDFPRTSAEWKALPLFVEEDEVKFLWDWFEPHVPYPAIPIAGRIAYLVGRHGAAIIEHRMFERRRARRFAVVSP